MRPARLLALVLVLAAAAAFGLSPPLRQVMADQLAAFLALPPVQQAGVAATFLALIGAPAIAAAIAASFQGRRLRQEAQAAEDEAEAAEAALKAAEQEVAAAEEALALHTPAGAVEAMLLADAGREKTGAAVAQAALGALLPAFAALAEKAQRPAVAKAAKEAAHG